MKLGATSVPFYLKTSDDFPLPRDPMFYLVARNGLFIGRNHRWFTSCVPAKRGPGELSEQKDCLQVRYPKIPQALVEQAVGFFDRIFSQHGWESAVVLAWNQQTQAMEIVVPDQKCSHGSVNYDIPTLAPHLLLIGDMHSHCDFGPHSSMTDEEDEMNRPGLHVVAGYLNHEPPEFYAAVQVDGARFEVANPQSLFEGYRARNPGAVPEDWLGKVKEKKWAAYGGYSASSNWDDGYYADATREDRKTDKKIMREVLAEFARARTKPLLWEVRQELFRRTRHVSRDGCEKKAQKFLDNWEQAKRPAGNPRCSCSRLFGQHAANCPAFDIDG